MVPDNEESSGIPAAPDTMDSLQSSIAANMIATSTEDIAPPSLEENPSDMDDNSQQQITMDIPAGTSVFNPPSSPYRDNDNEEEDNGYLPGVDDLPLFATKEAKKVDASNKDMEIKLEELSEDLRDMLERTKVMREHYKNVQQEVEHTNALYVSKQAEIKSEMHLYQLSKRSLAKSKHDTKKIDDAFELLQTQLNSVQNDIYKANEKLDEFKLRMKWNQEELEKWAIAAKQKDEDHLSLEKYSRADEHKIKELTLQQEQLTRELQEVLARLESELTDSRAKQMELDRVAIEVRFEVFVFLFNLYQIVSRYSFGATNASQSS